MKVQLEIMQLPNLIVDVPKPDYDRRFKKWYPKQKAAYDSYMINCEHRHKKLELVLEAIHVALAAFVEVDMTTEGG